MRRATSWLSNASSGEFHVLPLPVKIYGSFYAFEQGFGISRFFKIYVAEDGIHGAWLADRDCEFATARLEAMGGGGLASGVVAGVAGRARQLETRYDAQIPGSATWSAGHKQNFSWRGASIGRVALSPNPRADLRPNCYAILKLESGANKRRFYLVGESDLSKVGALLERVTPVEGNAMTGFAPALLIPDNATSVPGERARKAHAISWMGAAVLSLASCLFFYSKAHSWFALFGLILIFKFQGILFNAYLAFNVNRDTAERVIINRQNSPR